MMPFTTTSTLFPYTTLFRSNSIGLQRKGFSKERLRKIHRAYRVLLNSKMNIGDSLAKLKAETDLGQDVEGSIKRSEEHTSELQSPYDLVCRLLLEKKSVEIC